MTRWRAGSMRGIGIGAVTLMVAACAHYQAAEQLAGNGFGKAEGRACVKNGNPWFQFVCEGHPPMDFADGADNTEFFKWLDKRKWEKLSGPVPRTPANKDEPAPIFRAQSVREPQRFAFASHDDGAYLIARIIASPRGPKDADYGIGGDPDSNLEDNFYVVVRGFIADDVTPPENPEVVGPSRPISRWTIYGVERVGNTRRLKEVNSGVVRWCLHPHKQRRRDHEAGFEQCLKDDDPRRQEDNGTIARLVDPPLWFTCGLGCCISDFI